MELSTKILIEAAVARGCTVEILDPQDQFIRVRRGTQTEYIRQATKTRLDSYVISELLGNKKICKMILEEAGIPTPTGQHFEDLKIALSHHADFKKGRWVVKPKSTNYGIGITLLPDSVSQKEYQDALKIAFREDREVLVETFLEGIEARFLVIGKECVAVLQRIPAQVMGDGVHSIAELVDLKNQDPRRGIGHTKAFEKIKLGEVEAQVLAGQGFTVKSIPSDGQNVPLRKNSNISTGGESLDLTDSVHPSYKNLAVQATRALGAAICGVDIIGKDFSHPADAQNVGVIELNYNPALFIHNFPYQGKNRHVETKVLDLLGLI